jgi:hypothetical protein
MDLLSDNFISYDNNFDVKLEKSSDHEISLGSPTIGTCESTPNLFPAAFSPSLQSLLNKSVSLTITDLMESKEVKKKRLPFTIIKAKKETTDMENYLEIKIEPEEKLLNKSKLIMKREKAKLRAKNRQDKPLILKLEADSQSEITTSGNGEQKKNKKVIQMIRNRISAQTSRDRKKAYLSQLEDIKNKLHTDAFTARQENRMLVEELSKLKEENYKLTQENVELKGGNGGLGSNGDFVEKVIKACDPAMHGVLNQNKGLVGQVSGFAMVLSCLLVSNYDKVKMAGNSGHGNMVSNFQFRKSLMQEEEPLKNGNDEQGLVLPQDKDEISHLFKRLNNGLSSVYQSNGQDDNYMVDDCKLLGSSNHQNTIFSHMTSGGKSEKLFKDFEEPKSFNKQSIFCLDNFNLTDHEQKHNYLSEDLSINPSLEF